MTAEVESSELLTPEETESSSKTVISEESEKLSTAQDETAEGEDMKNKVKLRTADNVIFEVEPWIVKEMHTVQYFIDTGGIEDDSLIVPLPNVTSYYLTLIIEYCKEHCRVAEPGQVARVKQHLKAFDERFIENLDIYELKELIIAANYLNMVDFFDFLACSIANAIKNKSHVFVRNYFGVVNDYTPEEEAEYRVDIEWAFQNIDED